MVTVSQSAVSNQKQSSLNWNRSGPSARGPERENRSETVQAPERVSPPTDAGDGNEKRALRVNQVIGVHDYEDLLHAPPSVAAAALGNDDFPDVRSGATSENRGDATSMEEDSKERVARFPEDTVQPEKESITNRRPARTGHGEACVRRTGHLRGHKESKTRTDDAFFR